MADLSNVTFRDFATAIFGGDLEAASAILATLAALPPARARIAAEHFRGKTSEPSFLPKAMSLRTAVEGPDDAPIAALLVECFGLGDDEASASTSALRARYGAPKTI